MKRAIVIADASFCQRTGTAGWAAWIAYNNGDKCKHSGGMRDSLTDSNIAELYAAINGIIIAYHSGSRMIKVYTDNRNIVNAINNHGGYALNFQENRQKYFPGAVVEARHVKGHTQDQTARAGCNRWCDEQARKEMHKMRKIRKRQARAEEKKL